MRCNLQAEVSPPDRTLPANKPRGDSRGIVRGESNPLVTDVYVLASRIEVVRAVGGPTRERPAIEIYDQESGQCTGRVGQPISD